MTGSVVAITHAFSRRNAGDALLLELSLDRIRRAGIGLHRCRLLALDPHSFQQEASLLESVRLSPGEPWGQLSRRLLPATANLLGTLASLPSPWRFVLSPDARSLQNVCAIIGIGGGYLKADRCRSSAGLALNHLPSLLLTAKMNVPCIYLPQSVGPLRGPVGAVTRRLVTGLDHIFVRDSESVEELRSPNVMRMPDLAVLHLAERWSPECAARTPPPDARPVLAPRQLSHPAEYERRLAALAARLDHPVFAVQADGPEGRSDDVVVRRLGARNSGRLSEVLATDLAGVVVSVRLHGALEALLTGRPAIHLSYDRKGPSTFQALGLERFVHDAWTFDPATVQQQVAHLQASPDEQWTRISQRLPELQRLSCQLQRRIDDVLAPVV